MRRQRGLWIVGLCAGIALLLSGCAQPTSEPLPTLADGAPTATNAATEVPVDATTPTTMASSSTEPAATSSPTTSSPDSSATTAALDTWQLVYVRNGSLLRGDYWGAQANEIALLPQLDTWAFDAGRLALLQGRSIELLNLATGQSQRWSLDLPAEPEHATLSWGVGGQALLHMAVMGGEATARSVELRALDAATGAMTAQMVLPQTNGAEVLGFDDTQGIVFVLPLGEDPSLSELRLYDLAQGQLLRSVQLEGIGAVALSADGRYLATQVFAQEGAHLNIYDLDADTAPLQFPLPASTHAVALLWSPDGRYLAYVLQQGDAYQDEGEGLGLWVLELASQQSQRALDDALIAAPLVAWTPTGEHVVGLHRGAGEEQFLFAIRPDGGDRHILNFGVGAEILGWMPPVADDTPRITLDQWRTRFLATVGDAEASAQVVAEWLAAGSDLADDALTEQLREYLDEAGWPLDLTGPQVMRVDTNTWAVHLPPMELYIMASGQAQWVASGDLVLDAHLEGDDLGLIFGTVGASSVQPAFILLRRDSDGIWQMLWSPQGQRDWIATDGEISFVGDGLQQLTVRGSSFGLDEESIFDECHACLHRWLEGTWVRSGDGYAREGASDADEDIEAVWWSMTERTPYAILHELLARLQQGLSADGLVSDSEVLDQIQQLELLASDRVLVPEEETADSVLFSDGASQTRFEASVQQGQVVNIERLP